MRRTDLTPPVDSNTGTYMGRIIWTAWGAALLLAAGCAGSSVGEGLVLGSDCQGDSSLCQSGQCYAIDSATSLCTKTCTESSECPDEMLCDRVPVLGRVCLPTGLGGRCRDDAECPAGHRCDTDASRCYIPVSREICSPCTSSRQCPAGGQCLTVEATGEQYCTTACAAGDSCAAAFVCASVEGSPTKQCLPDNEGRTCSAGKSLCSPCRGDSECGAFADLCVRNLASDERFCGRSCRGTGDCPSGFNCLDLSGEGHGPLQCVPNSGTCSDYCDSDEPAVVRRQCGDGASCELSSRTCRPATDGRQCAACEDDDGCPSSDGQTRCLKNNCADCPYKGESFCAAGCTGAGGAAEPSKCLTGFFCVGIGTGGTGPFHCAPKSGTCNGGAGQQGDDCTGQGAAGCLSGICIGFGAVSVCSSACTNDAGCNDARYRCCAVTGDGGTSFDCTQPPGAAGGVCSPRGGTFGADCSPGQPPCFQGVCLDLGTARLCTSECGTAGACATDFTCRTGRRPKGDGSFEDVSVCFPDGGGGAGADCTFGPAACRSGYCVKKSSGNVCTELCPDGGACGEGFSCTATETVDLQSIEACIPDDLL